MRVIGLLEADLQGARAVTRGRLGPFFPQRLLEEPMPPLEAAGRALRAFEQAGVTRVLAAFVDEEALFEDTEDAAEGASPEEVGDLLWRARAEEDQPRSVHLTLFHEDAQFAHLLSFEARATHPEDEPGIEVLDSAEPLAGPDDAEAADPSEWDDPDVAAQLEAFLHRLRDELGRELPLQDVTVEVWTEGAPEAE